MCPTIELTAHDLVYRVLAVCQASIDELKYSKKKNRKAVQTVRSNHTKQRGHWTRTSRQKQMMGEELPGEKFSHILSKAFRLDSGVALRASPAFL